MSTKYKAIVELVDSPDTYCLGIEISKDVIKELCKVRKNIGIPRDSYIETKNYLNSVNTISYLTLRELTAIMSFLNPSSSIAKALATVQELLVDELAKRHYLGGNAIETLRDQDRIRVIYGELL